MSNTPESITFNLDAVEKDVEDKVDPFIVNIGGRAITMSDPADLDWQDLLTIENPTDFLKHCVSLEDKRHILKQRIPGWKFGKLMQAYQDHYRLDEKLAEARRQGRI